MSNIGDVFLRLLLDDSDFERQVVARATKAGTKAGQSMGSQIAAGISKSSTAIGNSLAGIGKNLTTTGRGLTTNLTLPIVAAGLATAHFALDFDTSMRRIVGLAKVPQGQIAGIREEILKLGGETGRAPQELADAFYFVASAGFKADEAMKVLRIAAKAAAAGMGDAADVAKVLGGVINAYGHENITAAKAGDILTAAIQDGAAEASDFAGAIGMVVPNAAALDVSFDQVAAAMSAMTQVGIDAQTAAVNLGQILSALQKPSSQAEDALRNLGLSSAGLRQELKEKGLLATLRTLEERFKGNETASALVFGNIRALRGVSALLGMDTKQLNEIFGDTAGALGTLGQAYEDTEGPQRRIDRAMAQLQATAIELGADVLPTVVDVLQRIAAGAKQVAKWWGSLDKDTKKQIVQWLAWAAVVGPVLILVGKLATGLGAIFRLVGFLASAKGIPALTKAFSLSRVATFGWIGAITLLVIALDKGLDAATHFFHELQLGKKGAKTLESLAELVGNGAFAAQLYAWGVSVEEFSAVLDKADGDTDAAFHAIQDNAGDVGKALNDLAIDADEAGGMFKGWGSRAPKDVAAALEAAKVKAAALADDVPKEVSAALVNGQFVVEEGMDTGVVDPVNAAMQKAIEDTAKAAEDLIAALAGELAKGPDEIKDEMKALREALTDPYTDPERRKDIEAALADPAILDALVSGDSQLEAETAQNVQDMLNDYELLAPGALGQGKLINPAFQKGIDGNIAGLMTYLRTKGYDIVSKFDLARALEGEGKDGLAGYIRGLAEKQQAAQDTAAGIARRATKALQFDAYGIGQGVVQSFLNGLNAPGTWAYSMALFGGKIAVMQGLMAGAGSPWYTIPREIGEGVGSSYAGALVDAIKSAIPAVGRAVGGAASQMALAPAGLSLAGALAAPASKVFTGAQPVLPTGGAFPGRANGQTITNQTNNYNLNVTGGLPVDEAQDAINALRRLAGIGT